MRLIDAIDELRTGTECHCAPAWTLRGRHHPTECFAWLRPDVDLIAKRIDALYDLRHPAVDRILHAEEELDE